jgi:hypothetical protein
MEDVEYPADLVVLKPPMPPAFLEILIGRLGRECPFYAPVCWHGANSKMHKVGIPL